MRKYLKKILGYEIVLAAQKLHKKLDFVILKKSVQNLGIKEIRKKFIAAKLEFGMDKRVRHAHVKYFLPFFNLFEMRLLFTPNFGDSFRVLKPKSRDL